MIQASDVSHTMQHWHVYRRWNECLFLECMMAYKNGRTNVDPAQDWYKGVRVSLFCFLGHYECSFFVEKLTLMSSE